MWVNIISNNGLTWTYVPNTKSITWTSRFTWTNITGKNGFSWINNVTNWFSWTSITSTSGFARTNITTTKEFTWKKKKKLVQPGSLERILISKWTSRTSTNEFTWAGVIIINGFTWTSRTSNNSFKMDLLTIALSGLQTKLRTDATWGQVRISFWLELKSVKYTAVL